MALDLLEFYEPNTEWEAATKLYFQAIALQHSNQPQQAQDSFEEVLTEFPDMGWALLAREKLD